MVGAVVRAKVHVVDPPVHVLASLCSSVDGAACAARRPGWVTLRYVVGWWCLWFTQQVCITSRHLACRICLTQPIRCHSLLGRLRLGATGFGVRTSRLALQGHCTCCNRTPTCTRRATQARTSPARSRCARTSASSSSRSASRSYSSASARCRALRRRGDPRAHERSLVATQRWWRAAQQIHNGPAARALRIAATCALRTRLAETAHALVRPPGTHHGRGS
jgi:hypothetical protein